MFALKKTYINCSEITYVIFSVLQCILLTQVLSNFEENLSHVTASDIVKLAVTLPLLILTLYAISRQPVSPACLAFKVPFVPWVPGFSLLINVYLMIKLDIMTWIRFSVWIAIGLIIFFSYSIRNSCLRMRREMKILTESESRDRSEIDDISLQQNERFTTQTPLMVMQSSI